MTNKNKFDTVCALSFTFKHETEKPNCKKNINLIKEAIKDKIDRMTIDQILGEIDFGETIETDL
tara:strand:- start:49 stop:240 length:192 start_codon:yes stop_codon:yes gene_type:complete